MMEAVMLTIFSDANNKKVGSMTTYGFQCRGPFHERFFHRNSNSMAISFSSHPSCSAVIAMKFCTCHDSCVVVACAKCCCSMIPYNGVTLKPIFHLIWITMEKSYVDLGHTELSYLCTGSYSYVDCYWTLSGMLKAMEKACWASCIPAEQPAKAMAQSPTRGLARLRPSGEALPSSEFTLTVKSLI